MRPASSRNSNRFEGPYASMVHDFIVTETTCCFDLPSPAA